MSTEQPVVQMNAGNLTQRQIYVVFAGVTAAMGLSALDGTIVNTALATIVGDLGGLKYYAWIGTSYMLTSTVATPLFGKLSDLYGRRRLFQIAILTFLLGSMICGVSQSMWQLVVARGIQGIGGGGLFSLSFAIIGDIVPPRERGRYVGLITSVFTISSVIGPLIGGFIVDNTSWRWIFLVNLPVGVVALMITNKSLKLPFTAMQQKVDYIGATLLVIAVSCLILGLSWTGGSYGWLSAPTIAFFAAALIVSIAFFRWESHAEEPIIPLHLMKIDVMRAIVPLMILVGAVFYGANAFMPLYLQGVTGVSATNSGLLLVPLAVAVAGTAIIIGRITSRTGTYKVWPPVGAALALVGFIMASLLGSTHAYLYLAMIASFFIGAGMGAIFPTSTLAVQNAVENHEIGAASSIVIFVRQLGGAIGLAIYGAIFNAQLEGRIDEKLIQTPRDIKQLESPLREQALEVFAHAVTTVFRMAIPVLIITLVLSCLIPGRQLKGRAEVTSP